MYILNSRLAADIFDGEYIIANLDTGLYYSVQGTAVYLIASLPFQDPSLVIANLKEAFPEHAASIEEELTAIVKELLSEEIMVPAGNATAAAMPAPPAAYAPGKFNRYADMQDLLMLDPIHDVDENGWTVQTETASTPQQ